MLSRAPNSREMRSVTTTDFTIEADELKRCEYSFSLSPALWDQYRGPHDLQWECAPFGRPSLETIPEIKGVYAFCVRPSIGGNLCGSYLLYIGMTNRDLRTRCREYLAAVEAGEDRPKVHRMLRLFSSTEYLFFCFAQVPDGDPAVIERLLLEATVPPACTRFPASVQSAVAAF